MNRLIDETGNRYNRLTVMKRAGSNKGGKATWLCQCNCGSQVIVSGVYLRSGHTKSCGCLLAERNRERLWIPWDEWFFDELNSDVAYIIGFIIADGHIAKKHSKLAIYQKDPIPLLRIAKLIDFGGALHVRKRESGNYYALRLRSQHAVDILTSKYKIPRGRAKSYQVRIPTAIPDQFLLHLVRGYFDGDGSVSPNQVSFSSGSLRLLDGINNILMVHADMPSGDRYIKEYTKKNGEEGKSYALQWTRQPDIMRFARYIYGSKRDVYGNDLFLRRKKQIFDSLFVPWRDSNWLYEEYVQKGRSKQGIANEFKRPTESIGYWIKEYGLETERTKHWNLSLGI